MTRRTGLTEAKIQRWLQEGRGKGDLNRYQPWLRCEDIPSRGTKSASPGWKTDRTQHFFSQLELHTFYHFEWLDCVFDIQEQYPLFPRERTLDIAADLGVAYPTDFKTKVSIS